MLCSSNKQNQERKGKQAEGEGTKEGVLATAARRTLRKEMKMKVKKTKMRMRRGRERGRQIKH